MKFFLTLVWEIPLSGHLKNHLRIIDDAIQFTENGLGA